MEERRKESRRTLLKKIGKSDRELKSWELYRSGGGPPIEQRSRVVRAWITISTFKRVCVRRL